MEPNEPFAPMPARTGNERTFAILSLVLGVINLCAWLLPLCGVPVALAGIVLGYLGLKAPEQKNLAIAGLALSALGLLLACANAVVGVVFAPQIQQMMDELLRGF